MNQYQKAYSILGLDPGSSKESIQRRYKRLIMVWHPDRFQNEDGKRDAEEELKKINNAKDLLWKHFESPSHTASGCECQQPVEQPVGASSQQSSGNPQPEPQAKTHHGPGPGPQRKTTAEEEAIRRDQQRKAKAAAEEAARQAAQRSGQQNHKAFEEAAKQQGSFDEERLRWKIALIEGIVFVGLLVLGMIAIPIADSIRSAASRINNQTVVAEKKDENDPCALSGTQSTPPKVIEPYLSDFAKGRVTQWTVQCDSSSGRAIVEGKDGRNGIVVRQLYSPGWLLEEQFEVQGSGNEIFVDKYVKPADFRGRCTYRYDRDGHLLSIEQVDSQRNTEITASVERRRNGKLAGVTVRPVSGNTTTYYDISGTDIKNRFFMGDRFVVIDDYVEPAGSLMSPEGTPAPVNPGSSATPFQQDSSGETSNRLENPFSRQNDTGTNLTPPSKSLTPETDKLLEKLRQQQ